MSLPLKFEEPVSLACELVAWLQMLALTGREARRWEPQTATPTAVLGRWPPHRTTRSNHVHLSDQGRWAELLLHIITTVRNLPAPAG